MSLLAKYRLCIGRARDVGLDTREVLVWILATGVKVGCTLDT